MLRHVTCWKLFQRGRKMGDAKPALPYRALTSHNPAELGERIEDALVNGYRMYGGLEHMWSSVGMRHFGSQNLFVQVMIDSRAQVCSPEFHSKHTMIISGDTSRSFCEEVSVKIEKKTWRLFGPVKIYVAHPGVFMLMQQLAV